MVVLLFAVLAALSPMSGPIPGKTASWFALGLGQLQN
jgi:hypothetical protein